MSKKLNDFSSIASQVDGLPASNAELIEAIHGYTAVLQHTLDGVEILDAPSYTKLPEDLLELRAFSETGELHLVKVGDSFRGRMRKDDEGSACTVFDEEHLVWGSTAVVQDDVVTLTEDRGTRVSIPYRLLDGNMQSDKGSRVTIGVRNYLDEDGEDAESGDTRFAFCDYRLVYFKVREVE